MKSRDFSFVQSWAVSKIQKKAQGTYNILVVRVQINAALLRVLPDLGNGLVLVGLVNDFRDDLGALLDQARVGRGELGAVNGVGSGIFEQQREEGGDAAQEEGYQEDTGDEEEQEASSHGVRRGEGQLGGGRQRHEDGGLRLGRRDENTRNVERMGSAGQGGHD